MVSENCDSFCAFLRSVRLSRRLVCPTPSLSHMAARNEVSHLRESLIGNSIDLKGRVAVVTGGSRGIGRMCCLTLARAGCDIVIAAKTTEPHPTLPGTIYTVAEEVEALGVRALPLKVDLRSEDDIVKGVAKIEETFGRIDILINNASALWWQDIIDTPMKKFDLIVSINARGTFAMTKACLPFMKKGGFGRVVNMSPPILLNAMSGHTAYNISKYGMTMVALGVSQEYGPESNITANTLWPATVIESLASINFKMGDRALWRKADIIADATLGIIAQPATFSGNMLIDDTFLRAAGFEDDDFVKYRCDPECEPPRMLDMTSDDGLSQEQYRLIAKRGDVRKLDEDIGNSSGAVRPTASKL